MSAEEHEKKEQFLFEEFETVTRKRWMDLVKEDLKGADFDRKLVWRSYEGISVQPMYFREDMEKLEHLGSLPGFTPHLRGSRLSGNTERPWRISQTHDASDGARLLEEIRRGVAGGQSRAGLRFHALLQSAHDIDAMGELREGGVWMPSAEAFTAFLRDIPALAGVDVYAGLSSPMFVAAAADAQVTGLHAEYDPVAILARQGSLPWSEDTAFRLMADSVRFAAEHLSGSTVIGISGEHWHNAGGSAVEEIACVLATGVEYLHQLQERGVDVETASRHIRFTFPVGSTFFMETAKLRAVRTLWTRVLEEFAQGKSSCAPMQMHACGSRWTQTVYDPYVNMLRSTVQAMAAVIGGAESLDIAPFDDVAGNPGTFSRRIARNLQIILQEEARLSQVGDAAAGSYYVEHLTASLMKHAWEMFREIESHGGMLAALKEGFVQERIAGTAGKKKENISRRRDIIVGTNQYPNLSEKPLAETKEKPIANSALQARYRESLSKRGDIPSVHEVFAAALSKTDTNIVEAMRTALAGGMSIPELHDALRVKSDAPGITPLQAFRASEDFERLRASVERSEKKPQVFLATYGAVNWSRARATFASGFFGAAGMEIVDNLGFPSPADAARAAVEHNADVVVACSEDDQYRETIPEIMDILRAADRPMLLVVAGNPVDDIPALREAGVHAFIHVRADVGALLADVLHTLGIEIQ
jgi:methylmalonyl-CoA mutase